MRSHIERCAENTDSDDDFEPVGIRFRVPGTREVGESSRARSPIYISDSNSESDNLSSTKIDVLLEMFPNFSHAQIETVSDLVRRKMDTVCTILLDLSSKSLLRVFRSAKLCTGISHVTIDPKNLLADGLKLYKSPDFDPSLPLEVSYVDQPAIDMGGVRRQFYSTFIKELATQMHLFEGDYEQGRLLPSVNHEAIISGTFKLFGKVIVHSVLMDGPGFPCFPPAIYRYMAGVNMEQVLPYLSADYLPGDIRYVIDQVRYNNNIVTT